MIGGIKTDSFPSCISSKAFGSCYWYRPTSFLGSESFLLLSKLECVFAWTWWIQGQSFLKVSAWNRTYSMCAVIGLDFCWNYKLRASEWRIGLLYWMKSLSRLRGDWFFYYIKAFIDAKPFKWQSQGSKDRRISNFPRARSPTQLTQVKQHLFVTPFSLGTKSRSSPFRLGQWKSISLFLGRNRSWFGSKWGRAHVTRG